MVTISMNLIVTSGEAGNFHSAEFAELGFGGLNASGDQVQGAPVEVGGEGWVAAKERRQFLALQKKGGGSLLGADLKEGVVMIEQGRPAEGFAGPESLDAE